MILSTGIDIVEVYRIRETMARTARFATRVFTDAEREYCDAKGAAAAQSYAGRFAAKEAYLKALGTGWSGKIAWTDVEIVIGENGVPSLNVTGEAKAVADKIGAVRTHLSISHTKDHAIAQVILESA